MSDTTPFDPTSWNFVKLRDFEFPVGIAVYELKNHVVVDGAPDFCRLNLYLSKDRDFVTIWLGLLEANREALQVVGFIEIKIVRQCHVLELEFTSRRTKMLRISCGHCA